MAKVTSERQALYALARGFPSNGLSLAAELEYDRLKPAWQRGEIADWVPSGVLEPALLQRESELVWHTADPSRTTYTFHFHRVFHRSVGGAAFK
jgi:hypothetical protein